MPKKIKISFLTGKTLAATLIYFLLMSCSDTESNKPVLTTSSDSAKVYYLKGVEKQARLKINESSYYFLRALSFDSDFAMANLRLAGLQTDQRIAVKYLNRAKKMFDDLSPGEQLLIRSAEAALGGDQVLQRALLKQLHESFPGYVPYMVLYANFLFSQGKYNESIPIYLKAIELDPAYHQSYNQIGYAYRNINDLENAEKYLKLYMEILPDEVNPLDSYAELMVKTGKFEKGLEVYQKAVATDSMFTSANIGVGTSLSYLGRTDEARKGLLKYYQDVSSNDIRKVVNYTIAATYLWDEDFENAIKYLKKTHFISDVTENIGAKVIDLYTMSQVFYENGHTDSARYYLKQVLRSIDEFGPTGNDDLDSVNTCLKLITKGNLALSEGKFSEADSIGNLYLSKSVIKNSTWRKMLGYTLLGYSALARKKYDVAYEYFNNKRSNRAVDGYYRGFASEMMGNIDLAKKEYENIINNNPILNMDHALFYHKAADRVRKLESDADTR